jgi:hypothetical protein
MDGERKGVGAHMGPRVIGRLTPELILKSPQYMNCINLYELDLRGCRITAIENLGATEVRPLCPPALLLLPILPTAARPPRLKAPSFSPAESIR